MRLRHYIGDQIMAKHTKKITENTAEKLCPETLQIEILDDCSIVANGAPCIKERCMAWDLIKYGCARPDKEKDCERKDNCYTECKLWQPIMGCTWCGGKRE
jgi:hypothetical protein